MKEPKMKPFLSVLDYNYGVKGTEIKFQEAIENYLEEVTNDKGTCWWQYCSCQIFSAVLNIYGEFGESPELLSKLGSLYDAIKKEVEGKARGEINMDEEFNYTGFYSAELVDYLNKIKEEK